MVRGKDHHRVLTAAAACAVLAAAWVVLHAQTTQTLPFNAIEERPGNYGDTCSTIDYPGPLYALSTGELFYCDAGTWAQPKLGTTLSWDRQRPGEPTAAEWSLFEALRTALIADPMFYAKLLSGSDTLQVYTYGNVEIAQAAAKTWEFNSEDSAGYEVFINGPFTARPFGACSGGSNPGVQCNDNATCTGGGFCSSTARGGSFRGFLHVEADNDGGTLIELVDGLGSSTMLGKITSDGTLMRLGWWSGGAEDLALSNTAANVLRLLGGQLGLEADGAGGDYVSMYDGTGSTVIGKLLSDGADACFAWWPGGSEDSRLCSDGSNVLALTGAFMKVEGRYVLNGSAVDFHTWPALCDGGTIAVDTGSECCSYAGFTCVTTFELTGVTAPTNRACSYDYSGGEFFLAACK